MSLTEEVKLIIEDSSLLNSLAKKITDELKKSVKESNVSIKAFIQSELIPFSSEVVDSSEYSSSSTGINGSMTISAEGLNNIALSEGFRAVAYKDPGPTNTWDIGYGHQIKKGEEYLYNATLTKDEAKSLLRRDVKIFEKYVKQDIKRKLTQGQFDALVDMYYQYGPGTFGGSAGIRATGLITSLNQNGITGNPLIDLNNVWLDKYPTRKERNSVLWRK